MMLLVVMAAAVFSFTSCNTDTEDYSIDQSTQRQYMSMMSGAYSGKMRMYYTDYANQRYVKYDSLSTNWTVRNDSTLTLYGFPVQKLDSAITVPATETSAEAQTLRELKTAISNINVPVELKCFYYIPSSSLVNSQDMSFFVNPVYFKQTLNYGGANHDVYFVFMMNNYGGNYNIASQMFEFNMYLQSLSIDKEPKDYSNSVPARYFRNILFTNTKK